MRVALGRTFAPMRQVCQENSSGRRSPVENLLVPVSLAPGSSHLALLTNLRSNHSFLVLNVSGIRRALRTAPQEALLPAQHGG